MSQSVGNKTEARKEKQEGEKVVEVGKPLVTELRNGF